MMRVASVPALNGLLDEPVLGYSAAQQLVTHVLGNFDWLARCPVTNTRSQLRLMGGAKVLLARTQPGCVLHAVTSRPDTHNAQEQNVQDENTLTFRAHVHDARLSAVNLLALFVLALVLVLRVPLSRPLPQHHD